MNSLFAITMGDPAGIGPEITLKALRNDLRDVRGIVVGDSSIMIKTAAMLNFSTPIHTISAVKDYAPGTINVLDMGVIKPDDFSIGKVQAQCGRAAYAYIQKAIDLALEGHIDGVITNPINKEAFKKAGIDFPGHTELFASRCNVQEFSMVFLLDNVGVAHVTTHCSVRKALDLITTERVLTHIELINTTMKRLGIISPRIAVGGLNPHAGEHGLFGDEEIHIIEPAIKRAQQEAVNVSGSYPPDTVFMRAFRGEFDAVVAMLHDHGFVALKSRDFEHGVNITVGLPIIRTSVGHGTAFDIAGKGIASEKSLLSAIEAAQRLAENQ